MPTQRPSPGRPPGRTPTRFGRTPIAGWTRHELLVTCAKVYGVTLLLAVVVSTVRAWRDWHEPGLAAEELPPNMAVEALLHALAKLIELTPLALLPAAALAATWFWLRR